MERCAKHPSYKAHRAPTADCVQCREIWAKADSVSGDRAKARLSHERKHEKKKYRELLSQVERLERELEAVHQLGDAAETHIIRPRERSKTSEATAIVLASDWHYEERVLRQTVNNLNAYSLKIADRRIERFWQGVFRLWQITSRDVKIDNIVLALLGDFVSSNIHEELLETCQLLPIEAALAVQERLIAGIDFLLARTPCTLVVPCHSGNHARLTKKQRHATESGNSLEWYLYHNLAHHFRNQKRVKFVISGGYHSYLKVYDFTLRFHHGHDIRFQGGVGGLYIPANKAIAQWNKARWADMDFFGHFHQYRDASNFICNGSLIGFSPYALSIKGEYEPPRQVFCLLDKKRGKTITAPILVED